MMNKRPSEETWINDRFDNLCTLCESIAQKLGGTAYLIGGAMTSKKRPFDVDIRIVIPDKTFDRHYDFGPEQWEDKHIVSPNKPKEWWDWHEEKREYAAMIQYALDHRNVDLEILPESIWNKQMERFSKKPRYQFGS